MTSFEARQLTQQINQVTEHCRDLAIFVQRLANQTWDMPPHTRAQIADLIDELTPPEDRVPSDAFGVPA